MFLPVPTTSPWSLFILKITIFIIALKKKNTHKSENILMVPFKTNDSYKKHHTLLL